MEKAKITFGRRLRLLRKSKGLTIEGLGRAASLGYKHVADVERGVKVPSFDAIDRLAEALDVEPHQFFVTAETEKADLDRTFKKLVQEVERQSQTRVKKCLAELMGLMRELEEGSEKKSY